MDDIQAPWIGDDEYGAYESVSQEDYDYYWQDEFRDEQSDNK